MAIACARRRLRKRRRMREFSCKIKLGRRADGSKDGTQSLMLDLVAATVKSTNSSAIIRGSNSAIKASKRIRSMSAHICWRVSASALFVLQIGHAAAAANFSETVDGDMSNTASAPSLLNLGQGANMLAARTGGSDVDLLRVTLPAWHTLDAIRLET